ncbi:response regulator [Hymenobacter sp. HMF4947]|uniref:Response regulator n=1 Tax=Hymenobacter ginkgonis TaxID=2682976 RepID=A0A7K1T9D4_9BACT|nr:response regulator [Hymenobacter ginkgonis]MVN75010.1 response regulator [Hymenobacter ginkgonis]
MQKLPSVLLVDDDHITNFLHEQLLLSLGVTDHCLVAENGAQALALLAELGDEPAPALVLLDVHMPVMGGVDFLEAYAQPPSPPPIIVVLSTSVHPHDQSRLATLPVADWVTKPLTREKIDSLLQHHFHRQLPPHEPGSEQ